MYNYKTIVYWNSLLVLNFFIKNVLLDIKKISPKILFIYTEPNTDGIFSKGIVFTNNG